MRASDLLLKCLEKQGVQSIFGVPGEENADIMISLLDSNIEFVTCRHEQTASFTAATHGLLSNHPGVCLSTLGPGATNLLTGVAQANMDNAPLIAIIGQAESERLHKESHQNMSAVAMYKPVTKWATTIRTIEAIPEIIAKAFKVAMDGQPGSVLIELPEDIAHAQITEQVLQPLPRIKISACTGVSHDLIDQFLQLLQNSQYPIVLAGDGATRLQCDKALGQFLDQTQIYACDTFMGKGVISDRYPRSLHTVGMGMKDIAIEAFEQADLVICIGYDMVEWGPAKWNLKTPKNIVHLHSVSAEVDQDYIPSLEMIGDIPIILNQINERLQSKHTKQQPYFEKVQQLVNEHLNAYADDDNFPMKPKRILKDIRATLSDNDIVISDVGAHKMWVARQYMTYQSKTCLISNGFCSMGGSIPGCIAAKRLYPDRNIVSVCGDGAFVMSIQALPTAVKLGLPFVIVVWEDDHYGLIQWKQQMAFDQYSHTELNNPDLEQLALAWGCHAETIQDSASFQPQLERALQRHDKPSVLIVPVDYKENMKLFHDLGEFFSQSQNNST